MRWVVVCAALFGAGCTSVGAVQTASTLGRGHRQFSVEPGIGYAQVVGLTPQSVYPHGDLAIRMGLTDSFDLGLRVGQTLLELQTKVLLTDPWHPRLAISLAPAIGGIVIIGGATPSSMSPVETVGILHLALPVLIGVKIQGVHELVIGPRLQSWMVFSSGGNDARLVALVGPGLSLGIAIAVTPSFRVMPEFAFAFPAYSNVPSARLRDVVQGVGSTSNAFYPAMQLKIGLLFGDMGPAGR